MTTDEHVDTVVVGSGFGGAVAAFRLAEAGRSVAVLERGKAYPPGSFPRSPREMSRAFWDPDVGKYGQYDVWSFDGFESVVASGLGGGSLIYANVLLRKDENWFVEKDPLPGGGYEMWPVTRQDLDPHYTAVETMLGAVPYPMGAAPYSSTRKTVEMQGAARNLGMEWQLPPLAVSFAPRHDAEPEVGARIEEPYYGNLHRRPRFTCRLDGGCDIGCNEGAKNSLDHTYLSAAKYHGADLRTLCEVSDVGVRDDGRYVVDYVRHPGDGSDEGPRTHRIVANRLILGAGAYGTTYLLLRSQRSGSLPDLGPALGTRFSGNGDLLAFLLPGKQERIFDASSGPVITSTIRIPDRLDGGGTPGRGFYLQDGGFPPFLNWLIDTTSPEQVPRLGSFFTEWVWRRLQTSEDPRMSDAVARLIGDGSLSAGSLPLLGMGRDVPDGRMSLDADRLAVHWTTETSKAYFERVLHTMSAVADELGATLRKNPLSYFERVVTVHPVGGAPMGHDRNTGVCDDRGQVFDSPGLYIADGAAMPGPIGPNPSLTIAAHADRMATGILEERSPRARRRPADPAGRPRRSGHPTGLSFTEVMTGRLALGVTDPRIGAGIGPDAAFRLTITVDDVDTFLADPAHLASVDGWFESDALGRRHEVHDGSFNLFVSGPDTRSRRMLYRLPFVDGDGNPRTLLGRKHVRDDAGADLWDDTTTLFARLRDGHVEEPPTTDPERDDMGVTGAGMLRLGELDLVRQLTTFRTTGPDGPAALARFGRFFLGELWDVYGPGAPDDGG